jgi:very-short-patch-repair endonuclease
VPRLDPEIKEHARAMRRAPTEWEMRLWRHLSNSQLGGYKFRRQATIEPFIVDFFCPAKGLAIEIDGDSHDAERDARRDTVLRSKGFHVLRFTNAEVRNNMDGVLEQILLTVGSLAFRFGPTPTQCRVNSAPRCSGHAGGMTDPSLLKGRGLPS